MLRKEFDFGYIEYLQELNICRVIYTQNRQISKTDLLQINELCLEFTNQKPYNNLTIIKVKVASTDEAKEYALGSDRAIYVLRMPWLWIRILILYWLTSILE